METLSNGKIRRSELEWREIYEKYLSSGLSASKFCRIEQLPSSSFLKWQHKFKNGVKSGRKSSLKKSNFLEICPQPSNLKGSISVELELGNGQILRIQG